MTGVNGVSMGHDWGVLYLSQTVRPDSTLLCIAHKTGEDWSWGPQNPSSPALTACCYCHLTSWHTYWPWHCFLKKVPFAHAPPVIAHFLTSFNTLHAPGGCYRHGHLSYTWPGWVPSLYHSLSLCCFISSLRRIKLYEDCHQVFDTEQLLGRSGSQQEWFQHVSNHLVTAGEPELLCSAPTRISFSELGPWLWGSGSW